MKKALCILLAFLMLIATLSGCAGKVEPLRILVDLDGHGATDITPIEDALDDLKWWVMESTGLEDKDIVFDIIPTEGPARESVIERIRTEVMSGGGPDVFIVQCHNMFESLLFTMPEKTMELDVFLPLDEYIETAELAEWDRFTERVMDAGRDEEGQQMVPLSYMLPVAMYRKADLSHIPSNMTWNEMQNTKELWDASVRLGAGFTSSGEWEFPIEYLLGDLADYQDETLLFTEEELLQHVTTICETSDIYTANQFSDTPYCTKSSLGVRFNWTGTAAEGEESIWNSNGGMLNGLNELDRLTLVPLYSDDGGCSAVVTSFAAVNRNTLRPEEAFCVLDALMMTGRQASSSLFHDYIYKNIHDAGMPMHEDLMSQKSKEFEMKGTKAMNLWFSLNDENFATVCAVRDQITAANFSGSINSALEDMMVECYSAHLNGDNYEQIVRNSYDGLCQMMAE